MTPIVYFSTAAMAAILMALPSRTHASALSNFNNAAESTAQPETIATDKRPELLPKAAAQEPAMLKDESRRLELQLTKEQMKSLDREIDRSMHPQFQFRPTSPDSISAAPAEPIRVGVGVGQPALSAPCSALLGKDTAAQTNSSETGQVSQSQSADLNKAVFDCPNRQSIMLRDRSDFSNSNTADGYRFKGPQPGSLDLHIAKPQAPLVDLRQRLDRAVTFQLQLGEQPLEISLNTKRCGMRSRVGLCFTLKSN
jgi:hypothetical protein